MPASRVAESAPDGPRSAWRAAAAPLLAGLLVAVFFLLLLARNPWLCWKDDNVISIMPVFADVARAWRHGEWPLLSPYSWACGNLAGEYQYGTFSPAVNIAVVVVDSLPLALPGKAAALSLSQLVLLAMGACLLARRHGVGAGGGVLVGLVAALNGWNVEWGATDWFGALAANAWLPWCWWAFEEALDSRGVDVASPARWWWRCLGVPAICVYLLLTGGFPYTVGMLALLTVWLAIRVWVERANQSVAGRILAIWPLATGWLLGLGLAAPAWLALLAYMPGSDRAHGVNVVPMAWAVPWTAWPALILPSWQARWPDFAGLPMPRWGLELAGGLVPVALLAASLAQAGWRRVARKCGWELGLTAAVMLLCMLPSPGIFRWSFRWLPLFALVLAVTAVRAEDAADGPRRRPWLNAGVWAAALVAVVALCGHGGGLFLSAGTMLVALGWVTAAIFISERWRGWLPVAAALGSLWLVYAALPTNPGVPVYTIGSNILAAAPLSPDRLYLSLYLEPYLRYRDWQTGPDFGAVVRPGSTSLFAGLHLINGYSPIMSAAIGKRLDMETHGNIPAAMGAKLLTPGSAEDALLARLGVDGLILSADYPLATAPAASTWEQVYRSREGTVYHRRGGLLPEVRAGRAGEPAAGVSIARLAESRQRVSVDVDVPAGAKPVWISFRRPFFPGYQATLNGHAMPVASGQGLMPMVGLPPGSQGRLCLFYRPRSLVFGGWVAAGCGLILAGGGLAASLYKRASNGDPPAPPEKSFSATIRRCARRAFCRA